MFLPDKLIKIHALIERASSEGERRAAILAKERIMKRQKQYPIEFRVTLHSIWQKRLFVGLCKKYDLKTYRYPRQKHTTTMVKISPSLMDECLWPEYIRFSSILQDLIEDVLNSVLSKIDGEEVTMSGELETDPKMIIN
jgi:hypothetical protein